MTAVADANLDEDGTAWLRLDSGQYAIRVYHLQSLFERGVVVTEARLVEDAEENWTIWVRLSDRQGEFRVNLARMDQPKTYRDVGLAIETLWNDFGYMGAIILHTERRRAAKPTSGRKSGVRPVEAKK